MERFFVFTVVFSHQQADVVDGEALEDVCKARLEVDRLAAEHRDACNVAYKCHRNIFRNVIEMTKKYC